MQKMKKIQNAEVAWIKILIVMETKVKIWRDRIGGL